MGNDDVITEIREMDITKLTPIDALNKLYRIQQKLRIEYNFNYKKGYPMSIIHLLDEATINQIAAGEVVERPRAVVKELIENAIDAGATAITAEIKDGGLSLIRITDNGSGIAKEDITVAFKRHATSKIKTAEDLFMVRSLGFRRYLLVLQLHLKLNL